MYRIEDMEKIDINLEKIKTNASIEYITHNEPTIDENIKVYAVIKNFIIKKKRVVYGGYAQNLLIKKKNPNEMFYKEIKGAYFNWPNLADIEFYTPTPIQDLIELTDELFKLNFKYVEGSEGIHNETYKVFVNFINYSDITYISQYVYNNLPIIEVDGIKCTHPHFMMVDTYRVITDPLTSYWRLDKSLKRFQQLIKYYPIIQDNNKKKVELESNDKILNFIRKKCIRKSKLVVVGFYAFNYYIKKAHKAFLLDKYPYYELISSNFEKDVKDIYSKLKQRYKMNITTKQFFPFFQFIDKRVEYYYNNKLILILYNNNDRCTVYKYSEKKKTYFGTSSLVYLYLLFSYYYAFINRNKKNTDLYLILIGQFFYAKNLYLDKHNITVIDKSPFQDFTIQCIGTPVETMRQSWITRHNKRKLGKMIVYRYTPGKKQSMHVVNFNNSSGNENKNIKKILK